MSKTLALLAALAAVSLAAAAPAAAAPAYDVTTRWGDTNLPPGGEALFEIQPRNVSREAGSAELTITDELPAGVSVKAISWTGSGAFGNRSATCSVAETGPAIETVTCPLPAEFAPPRGTGFGFLTATNPTGYIPSIFVEVEVDPAATGFGTNTATVEAADAATFTDVDQVPFDAAPAQFGLVPNSFKADFFDAEYPAGAPSRLAGEHPYELRFDFDITNKLTQLPGGIQGAIPISTTRTVEGTLPRGAFGNPEALPKCNPPDFAVFVGFSSTACPANTQVGYISVPIGRNGSLFNQNALLARIPVYNLEPPRGQVADLAFNASNIVQAHIYPTLDPAQNYAIKAVTPNITSLAVPRGAELTLWGVPADPTHDFFRFYPSIQPGFKIAGAPFTAPIRPFFTNPSDCGFDNGGARIRAESYAELGNFTPVEEHGDPLNVEACDDPRFRFEPDISLQPTSREAGGPTGLDVTLEIPQRDDVVTKATDLYAANAKVKAIPTPPLKKAVVTLPEGMTVSPSAAQGLGSCSPEQIALGTDKPARCPDNAQFGTLTIQTPLLPVDAPPEGRIYIAEQNNNPFHSFIALYLVIEEPDRGLLVKLPGRADLDPATGQLTVTFDDLPQIPMSSATMSVKGGLRAGLVNPQTCGTKTIVADLYSWHDPATPHRVSSNYEITRNPDGSPCFQNRSERPFEPQLSGGTRNNLAGSFSPLEVQMTRTDTDQELSAVEGTAPPGLLASLKGVGRCTDAAIAAAANPERTGTEEVNSPSCPADSLVGTVDAGSGVGQVLTYVDGKIYLAGPYKGAPLSGVAIVPAVAGPFDLGVIVSRAPAYVNAKTAEIRIVTDPLPLIFKGVPVRVRDIRVHVDRPNFTLNPTNCEPFSLSGILFSSEGKSKTGGSPFQAAECASLGFKPRLGVRLFGGTHRGAHPKLRAVYRGREGDANIAGVVATLPRSAFLDQSHIRTVCTRVQFAANACPPGAIYGHAVAKTPLLDESLSGPVFLRSSDNKLPDLVADLHGLIDVEVVGRIDSIRGGIRATFEQVPDAPVESFVLTMQGGKKGLLINSRDICAHDYRLQLDLEAQNGKATTLRPKMQASCKKAKRKAKRAGSRNGR